MLKQTPVKLAQAMEGQLLMKSLQFVAIYRRINPGVRVGLNPQPLPPGGNVSIHPQPQPNRIPVRVRF